MLWVVLQESNPKIGGTSVLYTGQRACLSSPMERDSLSSEAVRYTEYLKKIVWNGGHSAPCFARCAETERTHRELSPNRSVLVILYIKVRNLRPIGLQPVFLLPVN